MKQQTVDPGSPPGCLSEWTVQGHPAGASTEGLPGLPARQKPVLLLALTVLTNTEGVFVFLDNLEVRPDPVSSLLRQ